MVTSPIIKKWPNLKGLFYEAGYRELFFRKDLKPLSMVGIWFP